MKEKENFFWIFPRFDRRFIFSLGLCLVSFLFVLYCSYVFSLKLISQVFLIISDFGGIAKVLVNLETSNSLILASSAVFNFNFILGIFLIFVVGSFITSLIWRVLSRKEFDMEYFAKFLLFRFIFVLILLIFLLLFGYSIYAKNYLLFVLLGVSALMWLNVYFLGIFFLIAKDNFGGAFVRGFREGFKFKKYWKIYLVVFFFGILYYFIDSMLYGALKPDLSTFLDYNNFFELVLMLIRGYLPFIVSSFFVLVVIFAYLRIVYFDFLRKLYKVEGN